jgi:hypothetical protein
MTIASGVSGAIVIFVRGAVENLHIGRGAAPDAASARLLLGIAEPGAVTEP